MDVYVWVFVCVRAYRWMFAPINLCVWVEVSVGNRLIITAAPSFIIFIELFPAPALNHTSSSLWVALGSLGVFCVCVCVSEKACPLSADCFCQPALRPRSLQQEVTQLSDLSYYSQGRLGEKSSEKHLPSEWLSANGVPMVSSVLWTGLWVKIRQDLHPKRC